MSASGPSPEPVHPIERESYSIMAATVDFSRWAEPDRHLVARMVHATADESFAETARIGERAVAASLEALRAGAPVVCDSRMVAAGVPALGRSHRVLCYLDSSGPPPAGRATRSEAAVERAAGEHPRGALWVVGNAPTALLRLLDLAAAGMVEPAAVIGLPVGYVGAAEAKDRLWSSPLGVVSVTNRGRRGGSAVAAGALNALERLSRGGAGPAPGGGPQAVRP